MNRKDFELIAATLKARKDSLSSILDGQVVDMLVDDFADALRATNKQFNRDKFLRACGLQL